MKDIFQKHYKGTRGFTILEMIIVVSIIAIMSSIAAISFYPNIDRIKADMSARSVVFNLNYARIQAIKENNNFIVKFKKVVDADNVIKCYIEVHDDDDNNGQRDTGEKVKVEELSKGITYNYPVGKDIDSDPSPSADKLDGIVFSLSTPDDNEVRFNSRGNASDSGEVYMIPLKSLEKKRLQNRRMVTLDMISGRAVVWIYDVERDEAGLSPWKREYE
jgi:prepilin-type N-terminal cleavage/methylation domain-containing protein